jgi:hypothetical protein
MTSRASAIGRGMFSKAIALWNEGNERAVEMYEERAAAANAANGAPASCGRPKWMRDGNHTGGEMGPLAQAPQDCSQPNTPEQLYL